MGCVRVAAHVHGPRSGLAGVNDVRPSLAHGARWVLAAAVFVATYALCPIAVATESRCWPLYPNAERAGDAFAAIVAPVPASAPRDGAAVCLETRPTVVPGDLALHVLLRDAAGEVELLRRVGGFAELVVDGRWAAWRGRVEVLPGGTDDAPRVDVTGDGRANVLVRAWPRSGCCEGWFVLELGREVRVLFDDLAGHVGERSLSPIDRRVVDVVGDGWPEIVATDALAWPASCGDMLGAPPQVVTVFAYDRRLRAYAPVAPVGLAVHEASLRAALERLLGVSASSTSPLERGAWLLPDFWFGREVAPAASWCDALPLVTALLAAGRERDAWAAFDAWYRGDDHGEVKAWLQSSWWWTAPWRWERGLDAFAGEWIGEFATFVVQPSGDLDLIGGGRAVDVSLWGEGSLGERVGELRVLGRDLESPDPACPLLRGLDRVDGFVLVDGCQPERRYVLRPAAGGTAVGLEVVSEPHDASFRSGAHLVPAHVSHASDGAGMDVLAFGERLMAASCRGLRMVRNEVFARRGWVFGAGALADAFASERWYVPAGDAWSRDEVNAEIAVALSDADRLAVQLVVALERARGCEQVDAGLDELVAASEDHLRSLAPARPDALAGEGAAWETYLASCDGRPGRATDACREAVLVERLRRTLAAISEVVE